MKPSETKNLLRLFVVASAKDGKGDDEGPKAAKGARRNPLLKEN